MKEIGGVAIKSSTLYVVATPIGNLADLSHRALDVLRGVDLIAAEDTRRTRQLLSHYGIHAQLVAYHEHNESEQSLVLMNKLEAGHAIALVSDAGTPLVNDPGYRLVNAAHQAGIHVSPIPGACAAIAALSVSGLPSHRFAFEGFPPAKPLAREKFFREMVSSDHTLIFYESSHRILDSVKAMGDVFGADREVVIARELTKTFETVLRGSLSGLCEALLADSNQCKGEFVVLIAPSPDSRDGHERELDRILGALLKVMSVKQASEVAAEVTGLKKNFVYQQALAMKNRE